VVDSIVIGANGFLGSSVVDELAARGHNVTAFDRFSRPPTFSADVRSITGDLLDISALAAAIRGHDHVFHFQSTTTPASADGDPVRDVRENILPTIHLLDACVQAGVGTVHFASTGGAIYGDQGVELMSEHSRTRPVSPYAIGKLAIEGYLAYFSLAGTVSIPLRTAYQTPTDHGSSPIAARVSSLPSCDRCGGANQCTYLGTAPPYATTCMWTTRFG